MNGYLLSIVGIVFIPGILTAILPEGKTSGMIKSAAKLCCLVVILTPVAEFAIKGGEKEKIFSDFLDENVIQTDGSFIDYCSRKRIEETQTVLREKILKDYGAYAEVTVLWEYAKKGNEDYSADEIRITEIVLSFSTDTDENLQTKIVESFKEIYGVEVRCVGYG